MRLGDISYSMGQIINTSSREEYKDFFSSH